MSTAERTLILDTAERLFAEHCDRGVLDAVAAGEWPQALWRQAANAGLTTATTAAVSGELLLADAYAPLQVAGRHAAPLPLAESLLAAQVLAANNIESAPDITTLALAPSGGSLRWDGKALTGTLPQVAFGRHLQGLVIAFSEPPPAADSGEPLLLWLPEPQAKVTLGMNAAGEPCDQLEFNAAPATELRSSIPVLEILALSRAALMAGAMEAALEMTVGYATERQQFGRPLAAFQAIQQQLAHAAGEVAAATSAAEGAISSLDTPLLATLAGVAKARVGEAVAPVSAVAHQVHGAMGFTYEYQLHYLTRRCWVWRDEYGNEAAWQARLGRHVASIGADACWPFIVDPEPLDTA